MEASRVEHPVDSASNVKIEAEESTTSLIVAVSIRKISIVPPSIAQAHIQDDLFRAVIDLDDCYTDAIDDLVVSFRSLLLVK